jgi:hypothetical protein
VVDLPALHDPGRVRFGSSMTTESASSPGSTSASATARERVRVDERRKPGVDDRYKFDRSLKRVR